MDIASLGASLLPIQYFHLIPSHHPLCAKLDTQCQRVYPPESMEGR